MEYHDAANIFPLDEENIGDLAKDIRENGQQVQIETFDGKILDGRRRYLACGRAGVKPTFKEVSPADPIAYVVSLNLHRRHLSPTQLSGCAARAKKMYTEQAKERQRESGKIHGRGKVPVNVPEAISGDARDLVGKSFGVSGKMVDYAEKVIENGVPELVKAMDDNRISASRAAKIVEQAPEVQREVAKQATFSGGRYRKQDVEMKNEQGEPTNGKVKGVGVIRANEAINCLIRIPKNDALRKRGFQIVMDWIKANP